MRMGLIGTALLVALIGAGTVAITPRLAWNWSPTREDRAGPQAFARWLEDSPAEKRRFAQFEDFLEREGVADIVPVWQLTRADSFQGSKCVTEAFIIPPRDSWPRIVPALRLVKSSVKPRMGELEVLSTYRSPQINQCAGGTEKSRHLGFEALDLRVEADLPRHEIFAELCDIWRSAGPRSEMGLGAYFDPEDPAYNRRGRFHIDASGYRTWGRTYSRASSSCA